MAKERQKSEAMAACQFSLPLGITISGDVIFVAENGGNRTQKLTVTGEFLMKFGTKGSGNGQLCHAWGMCLSSNGNVYVTEYTNSRVQVFNPAMAHFPTSSRGKEQVHFNTHKQWHLIDPSGNLHIADSSSKWKLYSPVWKWTSAESNWNCSGPRWLYTA